MPPNPLPLMSPDRLLLANLALSLYMTGLIWFVQIVHYPLFLAIPPESFPAYERRHQFLTAFVTAPPMVAELLASLALLFALPHIRLYWATSALTLLLWASTFFLQVPLHNRLSILFDPATAQSLVSTNWLRTAAWTLRSTLLLWALLRRPA